jgi:hypothetical protein
MRLQTALWLLALLGAAAGCVKGTPWKTTERPPTLDRFEVAGQGWCGECGEVTLNWAVTAPTPETKVVVMVIVDGQPQHTFTTHTGADVKAEVCGNTTGQGATGAVAIAVEGLTPAPTPVPLQQSFDGEIRTLTFDPTCPFVDAWQDTAFTELLFPSKVRVDRIRNWTFFDTNQNDIPDAGEKAPKIKVSHAPELDWVIAQETWTDLPQKPTLHGTWKAVPESPPAFGDRCMEPGDVPSEAFAIPLQAKVRIQCFD